MKELLVHTYLYNRKLYFILNVIFPKKRHQNEHMLEAWLKTVDKR